LDLPIYSDLPKLRKIPHVSLCTFPSPVERLFDQQATVWVKRDDLNSETFSGNKARTLEWLLAGVGPGDEVITLGGEGSTHVLATALHTARLGGTTRAWRWRHDMNPTAERIAALSAAACVEAPVVRTSLGAMVRATSYRFRHRVRYVPLGGSVAAGVLAHVNAALELAQQIRDGVLPNPASLVVPLGSGGTTAGLLLGLAIAKLDITVVGVQVTPWIVSNRWNVMRLVDDAAELIERVTGTRVRRPARERLRIRRDMYGGAYGKITPAAVDAARWAADVGGIMLDQTYTAKAFGAALAMARAEAGAEAGADTHAHATHNQRPILFWNTFDGRILRP